MSNAEWVKWDGGKMPVRKGTRVCVKYRNGFFCYNVKAGYEGAIRWTHENRPRDIVEYRRVNA